MVFTLNFLIKKTTSKIKENVNADISYHHKMLKEISSYFQIHQTPTFRGNHGEHTGHAHSGPQLQGGTAHPMQGSHQQRFDVKI